MRVEWKHPDPAGDLKVVTEEADLMDVIAGPLGPIVILERDDGTFAEARLADLRCLERLGNREEHRH